jgi:hypothetical protein
MVYLESILRRDTMERPIEERIVKIPLPLGLIRQIDEAIVSGVGGYSTRTEFFREAAEGLLVELRYEPAPAEPVSNRGSEAPAWAPSADGSHEPPRTVGSISTSTPVEAAQGVSQIDHLQTTKLHLLTEGEPLTMGTANVDREPLFGMHNRDFPSIWVAFRLAEKAAAGPVPYESFVEEVTAEAWDYAEALVGLEQAGGNKLTALFPTNRAKPQSAAQGFKAFAVGSVTHDTRGVHAEGPLFSWQICQVERSRGGDLLVGLTGDGWRLLRSLDGISLELPHPPDLTRTFLQHLRDHSPGDWWGFRTVLSAVAEQPNRQELVERFHGERPDWTPSVAATNAQGYIARAREWGLVEPKQQSGRYGLTDFGADYLAELTNGSYRTTNYEGNGETE